MRAAQMTLMVATLLSGCGDVAPARGAPRTVPRARPTRVERAARVEPAVEPRVRLEPSDGEPVTVRVEVARTARERERGLMFREHLDEDAGMLFVFPGAEPRSFWMRNTSIPLDILFIGADRRVLGVVADAEPLTDDPREVPGRAQYVLEVHAGFARRYGIAAGARASFIGVPGIEGDDERAGER